MDSINTVFEIGTGTGFLLCSIVRALRGTGIRVLASDVNPRALEVVRQVDVEGHYLSARQVGDTIRLVVTQNGPAFDFTYPPSPSPADQAAALAHNRAAINKASLAEWLPDVTINRTTKLVPAPACGDIYLTSSPAGPGSTTVVTFSPSEGKVLDATSVMATASEVSPTGPPLNLWIKVSMMRLSH